MRLCDACGDPAHVTASVDERGTRGRARPDREYDLDLCGTCADLLASGRGWDELGRRAIARARRNVEQVLGPAFDIPGKRIPNEPIEGF